MSLDPEIRPSLGSNIFAIANVNTKIIKKKNKKHNKNYNIQSMQAASDVSDMQNMQDIQDMQDIQQTKSKQTKQMRFSPGVALTKQVKILEKLIIFFPKDIAKLILEYQKVIDLKGKLIYGEMINGNWKIEYQNIKHNRISATDKYIYFVNNDDYKIWTYNKSNMQNVKSFNLMPYKYS